MKRRIIGLTGAAGAGKDLAASMVPGACRVAFADPIYQGLSTMLGVLEAELRDRSAKERPIVGLGASPRQLLQTLGTEWGRQMVRDDIWLRVAFWRWEQLAAGGVSLIVVPDVRFENEARLIHGQGGEVWLIHRPELEPVATHVSEAGIPLGQIDKLIVNDGTVDQLRERVEATLRNSKPAGSAA
jgi:hypothetical protein